MPDESTVSTTETPQARDTINVVTEESQAPPDASTSQPAVPPAKGAPNTETPATSGSETPPAKPKTRRRSSERKIAALQRQLAEAETAGTARDVELAQLKAQVETLIQQPSAPPAKKPRLQDFKTAEEYADAHADWKTGQETPPAPGPAAPAPPPAPPQTTTPPQQSPEVRDLITEGAKLYEDFEDILMDKSLALSAAMVDHVFDSDRGPDLVMWLDENREEAQELFHLRPKKLAARFAEIEKTFDTPPAPIPPAAQPRGKASKQPDPPAPPGDPLGGNVAPGTTEVREGLTMDDYASRRRAQMALNRTR